VAKKEKARLQRAADAISLSIALPFHALDAVKILERLQ
jgi:hypothetical protein